MTFNNAVEIVNGVMSGQQKILQNDKSVAQFMAEIDRFRRSEELITKGYKRHQRKSVYLKFHEAIRKTGAHCKIQQNTDRNRRFTC